MNLRTFAVALCTTFSLALTAHSQGQIVYAPADTSNLVTQAQLANQSAADVAAAGVNVPPLGAAAGFQTSPQVQALITALVQSFVPGFTPAAPGSLANLPPATSANVGKYAVVSDLFGSTNEVLRAGYTAGIGYYWRPQRTDYATTINTTGGTITLNPLYSSPYVYLAPGQLASNLTIVLGNANVWPGAMFCAANNLTLGLFSVNLTGTGLSSTSMAQGAKACAISDGTNWRSF